MPWHIDHEWLNAVYSGKINGRCSGKSLAHATYILGIIEVNPHLENFIITGKNFDHLRHFQLTLQRVMIEMEIPFLLRNLSPWTICGKPVGFYPYGNLVERSRGLKECLIYDSNDLHDKYFTPRYFDTMISHEHIVYMKMKERVRIMLEEDRRKAGIRTGNNHLHQYHVPQKSQYTPFS